MLLFKNFCQFVRIISREGISVVCVTAFVSYFPIKEFPDLATKNVSLKQFA